MCQPSKSGRSFRRFRRRLPWTWQAARVEHRDVVVALDDSHVPACVEIAAAVGWKPPVDTWHWMLGLGEGWGVSHEGKLAGAVILFRFEQALAMVAMMMVHPAAQKLGLGRALLQQV